jgi:hypothetical protein
MYLIENVETILSVSRSIRWLLLKIKGSLRVVPLSGSREIRVGLRPYVQYSRMTEADTSKLRAATELMASALTGVPCWAVPTRF